MQERLTNARYILSKLTAASATHVWTQEAVCGILGNMEVESGFNPGSWQKKVGDIQDTKNGFGLTQWTPPTKLIDTVKSGESRIDIDVHLRRLQAEVTADGLTNSKDDQWLRKECPGTNKTLSFNDFITSNMAARTLAKYFLYCYEQPGNEEDLVEIRQNCAAKWYKLLKIIGDVE